MESIQSSVTHQTAQHTKTTSFTVGGKHAAQMFQPESDRELASLLGEANREGMAVAALGGGTHIGFGHAPSRLDWVVSTRKLDRVIAYEPPDMTLSVEAGSTLGEVQARLAEHGQGLPIEVADPVKATIGGILATA